MSKLNTSKIKLTPKQWKALDIEIKDSKTKKDFDDLNDIVETFKVINKRKKIKRNCFKS